MNNKGFGLVSALGIFMIALVLITSLMSLSSFQANRAIYTMVEDQIELTAQNAIDMVVFAIEESDDPEGDGLIPENTTNKSEINDIEYEFTVSDTIDGTYVSDNSYGIVQPLSIKRTEENVAIISVTVEKGSLRYELQGVMVASGFSESGLEWRFQNYAK